MNFLGKLFRMFDRVAKLEKRMHRMEIRMTAVDDAVQQLNEATDEVAADLEALREEVGGLDADAAAKLDPIIARLRSLAVDPANPVPAI